MSKLMERLKMELANGLPFMDGREKGEVTLGETMTVTEYGFLNGEDGEFLVFITKEHKEFFFGGSVLTQKFKDMEAIFNADEIKQLLEEGIKIVLTEKKSKKNRNYISVEFI